jgi:RHS repeat-associated protein
MERDLDGNGTMDARYRFVHDQVGSVRMVVDVDTGTVAQRMEYDSFGKVLSNVTDPGFSQPFGFAGGLFDADTGLVRFGARDYDSEVGRWTVKDPIGFDGGDRNLYVYVGDSPVNVNDPQGLTPALAPICLAPAVAPVCAGIVVLAAIAAVCIDNTAELDVDASKRPRGPDVCRCTIRYAPPDIMAICPPRVYGRGSTIGECQNNAKETAPAQCRRYYGHCSFFPH